MKFKRIPADALALKRRGLVCGIGVNDAGYQVVCRHNGKRVICPFYRVWQNMIERCYSVKMQRRCPTYKGFSVCDEWHQFTVFLAWMEKQDWAGKALDKDILKKGNKIYSPDVCIFVTKRVNQLLCDSAGSRSKHGVGVTKNHNKYLAAIGGKHKGYIGSFGTPEEANRAYRLEKVKIIERVAARQEPILREALMRHSRAM
jgi:hypothetical protein